MVGPVSLVRVNPVLGLKKQSQGLPLFVRGLSPVSPILGLEAWPVNPRPESC